MVVANDWPRPSNLDVHKGSMGRLQQFAVADRAFTEDYVKKLMETDFEDLHFTGYERFLATEKGQYHKTGFSGFSRAFKLHGPNGQAFPQKEAGGKKCAHCGQTLSLGKFSQKQWKAGPRVRKCKDCEDDHLF